jgi:hypothetical protein
MLERTIHLKQTKPRNHKKTDYVFETLATQQNHNIVPSPKQWKSVNKLTNML